MTEYSQPTYPTTGEPELSTGRLPTASTVENDSPSMKDKAADSAQAGKQAAADVTQAATDRAKDVATETKQQARNLLDESKGQLRVQADTQQRNAVSTLRSLGDELTSMAHSGDQSGRASELVGQAGERAHSVASWLDGREPAELLSEVRSFARRRPGAFLAGALVAGLVAGRLTRGTVAAHSEDSADHRSTELASPSVPGDYQSPGGVQDYATPVADPLQTPGSSAPYNATTPLGGGVSGYEDVPR